MNRTYGYDPNGNITSILDAIEPSWNEVFENAGIYTYQQATNRLTQVTGELNVVYGYDANGNITSANNRTFVYDLSNRLIRVEDNGTTIAEYGYNANNQRIKKVVQGGTRIFHYDLAGHLIAETNRAGQTLAEYIYVGDQPLVMIRPGELAYYFHNDHLGTPKLLTDENQNVSWKAIYTPFGEAEIQVETIENPFRFPGQYYDQETGLHYNWNRYYDPKTGRYLTPDPIGLEGGINLFTYVQNNPVNFTDPFGLVDKEPPVIRMPVPDEPPNIRTLPPEEPPIIKNPPPNFKPPDYTIPPDWYPPIPRSLCEAKCYLILFMDYHTCGVILSMHYLADPHETCAREDEQHYQECLRHAYNHYRRCVSSCSK